MFITSNGEVTQSQARNHLAMCLKKLGLDPSVYTFHRFRRSGATLAYNQNVNIQSIKRHGTWVSNAVEAYIVSDFNNASVVADMFQNMFSTTTPTS